MHKTIYVENEDELRMLLDLQNNTLDDGDEIVLKKDIILSDNLTTNKHINIILDDGAMLYTGNFQLSLVEITS